MRDGSIHAAQNEEVKERLVLAFLQHADALLKDLQSDRAIFLGDHLVVVDALLADASDKTAYRVSIKMAAARAEYQKFESKTPIELQVLKQGRRFVTGTVTMFCGGRPLLAVLGSSVTCHRPRVPSSSRAHAPSCPRQSSVSACIRPAPSPRSRAGPVCGCTTRMPPSRPGANPDMR
jgi:hypothetical protein